MISAPVCFVWAKIYNYMPLVWANIHCGSKMEKHDFEAEESWRKNSNSRTCYNKEQKTKRNQDVNWERCFKPSSKLDWKIAPTF